MADATVATTDQNIKIPDAVRENFPDLIPQIMASPSMDDDERNYWFSVLPIMSPDQIAELRDILASEQKKQARENPSDEAENIDLAAVERERAARREKRRQEELAAQSEAHEEAEELLEELDRL